LDFQVRWKTGKKTQIKSEIISLIDCGCDGDAIVRPTVSPDSHFASFAEAVERVEGADTPRELSLLERRLNSHLGTWV